MTVKTHKLHIISHSHWDREWYQNFAGSQRRLVFMMDRLLNLLEENADFRGFYLDGQTCILDDYLAIRSEEEGRVKRLLEEKRLEMGPWFVMPDELIVSGEALIRNLEKGVARCQSLNCIAVPMLHASDVFGHASQMPQIMHGFGIDKTMLLRGTSAEDEQAEMFWTGADGSNVWILKVFPDTGYCDIWTYRKEADEAKLREYGRRKCELASVPVMIGLDGNDHQAAYPKIGETISRLKAANPEMEIVHSMMSDAVQEFDKYLDLSNPGARRKFQGELRTPAKVGMWNEVFFGTASARVPTKVKNDKAQLLLTRVAEPLHALESLYGGSKDSRFLDKAWEYLLKCHPHDSIVGCSTDQVDDDVHYRLDQAIEYAQDAAGESLLYLANCISELNKFDAKEGILYIFNLASVAIGPSIKIQVETPHKPTATRILQPILKDIDDNICASSLELVQKGVFPKPIGRKILGDGYPRYGCRAHETGLVDVWEGYVNFSCAGFSCAVLKVIQPSSASKSPNAAIKETTNKTGCCITNSQLELQVTEDGRVQLRDLTTGYVSSGILEFEYQGDIGNGWDFKPSDQAHDSLQPGHRPGIKNLKVHTKCLDGLRSQLVIQGNIALPKGLDKTGLKLSGKTVSIPFVHTLELREGESHISVTTKIENKAKNIRLRVLISTNIDTDSWWSDSAFDYIQRSVRLPDTNGWKEKARPETPIHTWAAVCNDSHGLVVVTEGLQEACVLETAERPIALTLLRCYSQKIGHGMTTKTQEQGTFNTHYNIGLMRSKDGDAMKSLASLVEKCRIPLQCITLKKQEITESVKEKIPAITGFFNLSDGLQLSSFRTVTNGYEIRIFNPFNAEIKGQLNLGIPLESAQQIRMDGQTIGALEKVDKKSLQLRVQSKEIQTWILG